MHQSLPVTASDKKMSKRHVKKRIHLLKASIRMNNEHKRDHEHAEKGAIRDLAAATRRLKTVERL